MEIPDGTPQKSMKILGHELLVPTPFAEGFVCEGRHAIVLNQTLRENMSNNFRPTVQTAIESGEESGVAVDTNELQKQLNDMLLGYEFGQRTGGGGGGRGPMDPVEKEARSISRNAVRAALKERNFDLKEVGGPKITELANKLLESDQGQKIYAEARTRVEAAAEVGLDTEGILSSLTAEA